MAGSSCKEKQLSGLLLCVKPVGRSNQMASKEYNRCSDLSFESNAFLKKIYPAKQTLLDINLFLNRDTVTVRSLNAPDSLGAVLLE